jgi:hypothetical protein
MTKLNSELRLPTCVVCCNISWLYIECVYERDFNILASRSSEKNGNSEIDLSKEPEMMK